MPFISNKRDCARCCNQYRCSNCPQQVFLDSCSLIKHLRKSLAHKRKDQTFDCTICNKTFALKTGYIHHLQHKRIHRYDLHQAACCGRYQDVSQLINSEYANVAGASHKSDTQLNYQLGATPMHCAAFKGYSRCLRIMLGWQDGDPNVVDEYGQTPVHIAARCGKASSLKLLLCKGGRLDVKDVKNKTPISLAQCHNHCMNVVIEYQLQRKILKYFETRIYVQRSSSIQEVGNVEELDGDISDGELSNITEESKTVCRSLSFPRGDNSEEHEELFESELQVATKGTMTASLEQTNGNEQQVVGHHESMLEDGNSCISEVSSELVPYEIIARGENSVNAFKVALSEDTAPLSRLKLIVVGEVGAGKTCLTRSLSQQPFIETREKTRGIKTSTVCGKLVENTELDVSWKLADPGDSHLDDMIAKIVSESLAESTVPVARPSVLSALPVGESEENQIAPGLCTSPKQPVTPEPQARVLVTQSSIPVAGTPRKLPATRIAKRLFQKKKEGFSFKVSIWDFAGHQLYETMHHVFMNNRSLYLVVFNLIKMVKSQVKCLARIHYWLNSIASHTSCSTPIVLVGTHKAMVDSDFLEKADELLEKDFGFAFAPRLIRNSEDKILFAVENVEGQHDEGVSSLIKVIMSEASSRSSLSFVSDKYPLKWLHCEEEIVAYQQVSTNKKFMTLDELKEFLQSKCDVTFAVEEFSSMLAFFHDSGLILLPDTTGETKPCIKDIVVLSPQYLVDVMTHLHDIPKDRHLKRQFSDEFKMLKEEGRADCSFLNHLWKDFDKRDLLLELLAHFNLLYPVDNEIDDSLKREDSTEDANSLSVQNVSKREFIIPCMLKEKSSESVNKRWDGICESWDKDEHVLVFDFGRFLPPPLFDYLAVHIYRHSHKTKGMRPFLTRRDCIFSFSNKFLFRLKLFLKDSQICVYARCKNGAHFLNLACKLRERVSHICQKYFKFLKFICGPRCPRSDCPGASFDAEVVQRPCESSSSESPDSSDDDKELRDAEEKESKGQAYGTGDQIGRRCHVIPMTPYSFDPPYWCQHVAIDEDDLKDWNHTIVDVEDLCESFEECEIIDGSPERIVKDCCLSITSDCLGKDWKEVTRKLGIEESELENIVADNLTQKESCFQGLKSWSKRVGSDASVEILKDTLVKNGRKDVSEKLEQHFQENHK